MTLGKSILTALEDLRISIRDGKPVQQSIVRRMTVKGKTVYTREKFKAPIK